MNFYKEGFTVNTKKVERIIVIAYSAYTLAMSVAATVLQWPAWITPTIIGIMLMKIFEKSNITLD